jgi:peptidoglycan-N-acetylglucosamine deacetylase
LKILLPAILIIIFILNYIIPHLFKKFWRWRFLKWANVSGKIYLTFDDGPDVLYTEQILDILKQYEIKATFFVLSVNIEQKFSLINRIKKDGHVIGIHGDKHLHPWKVLPWKAMEDISRGKKTLENIGIKTKYVRPPYGKLNIFSLFYILINGLIFIHWNLDPEDYFQNESGNITRFLLKEIQQGKVILLHDGRQSGTSPGNVTVKGLADLLKAAVHPSESFSPLPINGLN